MDADHPSSTVEGGSGITTLGPIDPTPYVPDLQADCVTISMGPDNGALDNAAHYYATARRNNRTIEATSNIVTCAGGTKRSIIIFGHGAPGLIKTGNGDDSVGTSTDDQYIAISNRSRWVRLIYNLGAQTHETKLVGCSIGAADAGADLLVNIATTINSGPVVAPTYFVWAGVRNGTPVVYLDDLARWQIAYPNQRPTPIPLPKIIIKETSEGIQVADGDRPIYIPFANIIEVDFKRVGRPMVEGLTPDAVSLFREIDWGHPFRTPDRPLGLITGEFVIECQIEGHASRFSFNLIADGILESTRSRGLFYRISSIGMTSLSQR